MYELNMDKIQKDNSCKLAVRIEIVKTHTNTHTQRKQLLMELESIYRCCAGNLLKLS